MNGILNKILNSDADFVKKLLQSNRQTISAHENPNGVATHRLSVATDENGVHYIYPQVQRINGEMYDFTDPKYKDLGIFPKFQPGGLISSPEESEQYRYERSVDKNKNRKRQRPLEELNNSKLGKILDWADLGLDVVSMANIPYVSQIAGVAGMVTGIPQALAGGYEWVSDMAVDGFKAPTLDQTVAMAKLFPTGNVFGKVGRKALLTKSGPTILRGTKPYKILSKGIPNGINFGSDVYEIVNNSGENDN